MVSRCPLPRIPPTSDMAQRAPGGVTPTNRWSWVPSSQGGRGRAMGNVEVVAAWVRRFGADDLWRPMGVRPRAFSVVCVGVRVRECQWRVRGECAYVCVPRVRRLEGFNGPMPPPRPPFPPPPQRGPRWPTGIPTPTPCGPTPPPPSWRSNTPPWRPTRGRPGPSPPPTRRHGGGPFFSV